ncbi:MAG: DNA polymerase III subunit beta [Candidatus Margulisbacteria bacterium]|nr:DNA polymerase III subunit beta [Candidatus Margulisiibacteriota bacterium]
MEFTCEKKDLQTGVSAVEKIVTTRSTLPIIGYILFDADKNGLKISANNLEMGVELGVKAKVIKEGSVLVPAKTLTGIVSRLPEGNVSFKLTEKGTIRISYAKSQFNVHTLPPDEFPVLPKVKDGKSLTISGEIFVSMIRQTIFAVSSSEDKYVLTGVLLDFGKSSTSGDSSNFRMISTDGYRLAKRAEKIKLKDDVKGKVIVPSKALQELSRIIEIAKDDSELRITFSSDQIAFRYNDVLLVSRIIQGQFPDFKQVLPKKSSSKIITKRKAFLEAADRTSVIAAGSANIVRFETKSGQLRLFASTPDVGTVDEVIEAEVQGEAKTQIAFNIRLITDVLKALETDNVVLEMSENLGPGMIKEDGVRDYVYIVMPIRTQEGA